jgi:hypothetical protein
LQLMLRLLTLTVSCALPLLIGMLSAVVFAAV